MGICYSKTLQIEDKTEASKGRITTGLKEEPLEEGNSNAQGSIRVKGGITTGLKEEPLVEGNSNAQGSIRVKGGINAQSSIRVKANTEIKEITDVNENTLSNIVCQINGKCESYVKTILEAHLIKASEKDELTAYLCTTNPAGKEFVFDMEVNGNIDTAVNQMEDQEMQQDELDEPVQPDQAQELYRSDHLHEPLETKERRRKWKFSRKSQHYTPPDSRYSSIHEESWDFQNTEKRLIYVMSDLHLGGFWSKGMEGKIISYLNSLMEQAYEKIAGLVLLGDVFEMWLDQFHQVPRTNAQLVSKWKLASANIINAIKRFATDGQVKVYYVRGNHDHEITEKDVTSLFDGLVTFVPGTLILKIQIDKERVQRARFSHGHEYDIFNSYLVQKSNHLLCNRPIGYYVARAVSTAGRGSNVSDLENILIGFSKSLLNAVPKDLEDDLVDVLMAPQYQQKLAARLFEAAFKVDDLNILQEAKCRMTHDGYVSLRTMLEYPFLKLSDLQVGKRDVFHMIKASTGDYKMFLQRSDEDVVVMAHTHTWELSKYKNEYGNSVIYANTGCWTNCSKEFSAVVLDPPRENQDGSVLIDYGS